MKLIIEINDTEKNIKEAIAKGWNERFGEELTGKDIGSVQDKEEIICAIPYIELEKITLKEK